MNAAFSSDDWRERRIRKYLLLVLRFAVMGSCATDLLYLQCPMIWTPAVADACSSLTINYG
jgi:hypothetical protein